MANIDNESHRITDGPGFEEKPSGLGTVSFSVACAGDSWHVLDKAKSVLRVLVKNSIDQWPTDDEWKALLPAWFVAAFAPEQSPEEAEQWLQWWRQKSPSEQERIQREEPWSLSNWLYWFESSNRLWYWWDSTALDADTLTIVVQVTEWPFPWGSLAWLFRACGACRVAAEEERESEID